jgi:hypothetical protein
MSLQQALSNAQTQSRHGCSSQLGPSCGAQQSPPGVGVAAGVSVGSGSHVQLEAHSSTELAIWTHVASHFRLQHNGSVEQTQSWQVRSSHSGPRSSDVLQQSPPGVGVGCEHEHTSSHSSSAIATDCSSHSAVQENGSMSQTQAAQAALLHEGASCGLQQLPGVGVGV